MVVSFYNYKNNEICSKYGKTMQEYFYLLSGNIDPSRDTDKIHLDIIKETQKDKPKILLFATASFGTDWHEKYIKNLSNIFSKYPCEFQFIEDTEDENIKKLVPESDVIYFLGGSPYKHTKLTKYKELFQQVPIKVGTSAGAIYLGYPIFYFGKEDYVVAVPDMLGFVDLHMFPHSESYPEEIVSNYLLHEANVSFAKLYNQTGIKIERINNHETLYFFMGETPYSYEKIELFLNNKKYLKVENDSSIQLPKKLILI